MILFTVFALIWFPSTIISEKLTASQEKALDVFRSSVESELYLPYMRTDAFLLRWLEDREFDADAAKTKLLKAIKWRLDNNLDNILNEEVPFVGKYIKYITTYRDNFGNPVVTLDFNTWDIRRIALAGKMDLLTRQLAKMMEEASNLSAQIQLKTPTANQWVIIANYMGFSLRTHGCLSCIPFYVSYVHTYENYFTGSTRNILVLNCPRTFDSIASLARGLMSPGTRKSFKIYSTDNSEWDFLDTVIPRDNLPKKYGGTLQN